MRKLFNQIIFLIPVLGIVASCTPEITLSTEEKEFGIILNLSSYKNRRCCLVLQRNIELMTANSKGIRMN